MEAEARMIGLLEAQARKVAALEAIPVEAFTELAIGISGVETANLKAEDALYRANVFANRTYYAALAAEAGGDGPWALEDAALAVADMLAEAGKALAS